MPLSDEDTLERVVELSGLADDPPRCGAHARSTGKPCVRRPRDGEKRCRTHGGARGRRLANIERSTTHGTTAKYIETKHLPEIWRRMQELKSPKGKEEALLEGAALVEQRLKAVPNNPDYLNHYVAGRKSVREDLKTSVEIAKENAPVAAGTVVQVYAPGAIDERFRRFDGRGMNGIVTIQLIDGEPWIYDSSVEGLFRATKSIDKESGAEIYQRLLTTT